MDTLTTLDRDISMQCHFNEIAFTASLPSINWQEWLFNSQSESAAPKCFINILVFIICTTKMKIPVQIIYGITTVCLSGLLAYKTLAFMYIY